MNILLLGKNGQVGWELARSLAPLGHVVACDSLELDLADPDAIRKTGRELEHGIIVNAAAHTAVDKAESEPGLAMKVNVYAPGILAEEANRLDSLLVHYSTDYVFDGKQQGSYSENDPANPLSIYGKTKLAGEEAIRASCAKHLIFRTSWVYGMRGRNFLLTMLRLAQERERLTVIDDQWGAPTGAELLADCSAHAIRHLLRHPQDAGLYHLAAAGEATWFSYAQYVLEQAQKAQPALEIKAKELLPFPASAYPLPAPRPHNSRLDCARFQSTFGLVLPPWQQGVARMLMEVLG
jgi:dTDP-4-dehydrorhamnose reductase